MLCDGREATTGVVGRLSRALRRSPRRGWRSTSRSTTPATFDRTARRAGATASGRADVAADGVRHVECFAPLVPRAAAAAVRERRLTGARRRWTATGTARCASPSLALAVHPRYAVVIAANRDEFHARPAAPGAMVGRRLARRARSRGRRHLARRDAAPDAGRCSPTSASPARHDPRAPSRGALVTRVLGRAGDRGRPSSPRSSPRAARHNGFNLLGGDVGGRALGIESRRRRACARARHPRAVEPSARHAVAQGRAHQGRGRRVVRARPAASTTSSRLFDMLGDRTRRPRRATCRRPALPLERERLLSAPFIVSDGYGTRCSTLLDDRPRRRRALRRAQLRSAGSRNRRGRRALRRRHAALTAAFPATAIRAPSRGAESRPPRIPRRRARTRSARRTASRASAR